MAVVPAINIIWQQIKVNPSKETAFWLFVFFLICQLLHIHVSFKEILINNNHIG